MASFSPNVEGLVESEMVPVTLLSVRYKIDLRAWYRALEFQGRTKDNPFVSNLSDLVLIAGEYDGVVQNAQDIKVTIPVEITVENP
jgi:hypothetical protein